MDPNKPIEMLEESGEIYTPWQKVTLTILKFGAWTAAYIAMLKFLQS